MTEQPHRINLSRFEIGFPDYAGVALMQDRISRLFNQVLTSEISKVLSFYAPGDEILQIPSLTLDIGVVELGDLETEIPQRVIAMLHEQIGALIVQSGWNSEEKRISRTSPATSYLEAFRHYLVSGHLRWQDTDSTLTPEELLVSLLRAHISELINLLRREGKQEAIRRRIAWQFSEEAVVGVIHGLEPTHATQILNYMEEVEQIHMQEEVVKAETSDFKRAKYYFVLTYLLAEKGSYFNTKSFLESILRQIAAHYNMEYGDLLLSLVQNIRKHVSHTRKDLLPNIIQELFLADQTYETIEMEQKEERFPSKTALKPLNLNEHHEAEIHALESSMSIDQTNGGRMNFQEEFGEFAMKEVVSEIEILSVEKRNELLYYFLEFGFFPGGSVSLSETALQVILQDMLEHHFDRFQTFVAYAPVNKVARNLIYFFPKSIYELIVQRCQPKHCQALTAFTSHLVFALEETRVTASSEGRLQELINEYLLCQLLTLKVEVNSLMQFLLEFADELFLDLNIKQEEKKKIFEIALDMLLPSIGAERVSERTEALYAASIGKTLPKKQFSSQLYLNEEQSSSKMEMQETQFQDLQYFLLNGRIPWWRKETLTIKDLAGVWELGIQSVEGEELSRFLGKHITRQQVRKNVLLLTDDEVPAYHFVVEEAKKSAQVRKEEWVHVKQKMDYSVFRVVTEARILFDYFPKASQREGLWPEMEKIFSSRSIGKKRILEELLNLQEVLPAVLFDDFFSFLSASLTTELDIAINETSTSKGSEGKVREEKDIGVISKAWRPSLPKDKEEESNMYPEQIFEKENNALEDKRSYARQAYGSLPGFEQFYAFSAFLQTGNWEDNSNKVFGERVNQILEAVGKHPYTVPEWQLLRSLLKRESIRNRLFRAGAADELYPLISTLYTKEFRLISSYLSDFQTLFSLRNLKHLGVSYDWLLRQSLDFVILNVSRSWNVADYIRFIIKGACKDQKSYTLFLSQSKISLMKKEVYLKTALPAFLQKLLPYDNKVLKKAALDKKDKVGKEKSLSDPEVFVGNAGMVILWPFLVFYFQKLGLVIENKFVGKEAAVRGTYLLQYLVTGKEDDGEHLMSLNKILCGLPLKHPLTGVSRLLTDEEKELSSVLLSTMISRWTILKNTSPAGVQETFLQRKGKMLLTEEKDLLKVERKAFDMLLDKLPWTISIVRLPWMERPLNVFWR